MSSVNATINVGLDNNTHINNVSIREPYTIQQIGHAFAVSYISFPILLACCTTGNILSLVVLAQEKRKGSTNIYMTSMVVSDFFVL